jgi:CAAX protease family protein
MSDWQPADWVLRQGPPPPPPENEPSPPPSEPDPLTEPFWGYRDLLVFVGLSVPSLLLGIVIVQTFILTTHIQIPGKASSLVTSQFIGYGFWFLSLYVLLRVRYDRPFWRSLGWTVPWRFPLATLFGGPALAFAVGILGSILNTPNVNMPIQNLLADRTSVILVGLMATTLGPVCEELAFRGFLLPLLVRSFGVWLGLVLSSLPFALLHGPQYGWHWQHIVLLTIASVVFGGVRIYFRSTAAATLVHATYNLTFFVAYVLQRKEVLI